MKLIITTTPHEKADQLVQELLSAKLIGCGNIFGIKSLYQWKGKLCDDSEAFILMETDESVYDQAISRLTELHPYEVPKIITLDPLVVNTSFLEWLKSETKP